MICPNCHENLWCNICGEPAPELDYKAAAIAWVEKIPFHVSWENLTEREQNIQIGWAKIVVDAAYPQKEHIDE